MRILGTDLPLTPWSVVVLLAALGTASVVWPWVVDHRGWRPRATITALLSTAVIVALTVTPGEVDRGDESAIGHGGLWACVPQTVADLVDQLQQSGGSALALALNGVLFLPLTAALVLAGARTTTVALVAVALPAGIEIAQSVIPGRMCSVADLAANVGGALLGLVLGTIVEVRRRCPAPPPSPS